MKSVAIVLSPFFLLAFFFLSGFTDLQDDRAEKILKSSKSTFDAQEDFTANFRYGLSSSRPDKKTTSIEKTGTISFKKGMFLIDMEDQAVYCDKESQWVLLKEDKEVNIFDYDPDEGVSVEAIFSLYESNAKTRYDGEETMNGKVYHKIFLAATDDAVDYNQVKLWINKKTNFLEKAVLIDRRQTVTTMEFSNISINNGLKDSIFRFDQSMHSNVDVYDER